MSCSGSQAALTSGVAALAPAARVALVGCGPDTISIDMGLTQTREISFVGLFRYANTYPLALQLIAEGKVEVKPLITGHFSLEETAKALVASDSDPKSMKAVGLP